MVQIVVISKSAREINEFLEQGWKVVSVTAQVVASHEYGKIEDAKGSFLIVLQKE